MRRRPEARGGRAGPGGSTGHRTVELDLDIYTFDIDFAGHVSNITYIRWLEIGRLQLLVDAGIPTPELLAEGLAPLLVHTEIDYRMPLKLGDPVHMSLDLAELRAASAAIDFRITSNGRLAAAARQLGIFVRLTTGKPARITPDRRARFAPYLQQEPSDRERLES
jgi:acyl-CoA thioester hydrolase